MTDAALRVLWKAVLDRRAPPFDRSLGIANFWAQSPYEYGPVLSNEIPEDGGSVIQMFGSAAIRWTPGVGAQKVVS